MRRPAALGSTLVLAVVVALALGAPVHGPSRVSRHVLDPFAAKTFTETFKGGDRALVIVSGNGATYMGLYVYDEHGNCVATDDLGDARNHDDLAAEWYPHQTAPFRIEVRNFGPLPNTFQMALR